MSVVVAYLNKAARSFDAAGMSLAKEHGDFAASRARYGCFHVARALLFSRGMTDSTHAGTISEYGGLFATSGRLDPNFHRLLIRSFHARRSADHDLDFDLGDAGIREMIAEGKESLDAAKDGLAREDAAEQS